MINGTCLNSTNFGHSAGSAAAAVSRRTPEKNTHARVTVPFQRDFAISVRSPEHLNTSFLLLFFFSLFFLLYWRKKGRAAEKLIDTRWRELIFFACASVSTSHLLSLLLRYPRFHLALASSLFISTFFRPTRAVLLLFNLLLHCLFGLSAKQPLFSSQIFSPSRPSLFIEKVILALLRVATSSSNLFHPLLFLLLFLQLSFIFKITSGTANNFLFSFGLFPVTRRYFVSTADKQLLCYTEHLTD